MKNQSDRGADRTVWQFLIVLSNTQPLVWRRIQVPVTYSFWDLHVAIQDAMGWLDYHLHEFKINDPRSGRLLRIGIPFDDEPRDVPTQDGALVPIANVFTWDNDVASYVYDFGDNWRHAVISERRLPVERGVRYPRCVAGEMHCPPEDCGGPMGYNLFLEAIADPDHEEHESYLTWIGGSFDPQAFDPDGVAFDDPDERWQIAFGER
jgi:hypothetical protein